MNLLYLFLAAFVGAVITGLALVLFSRNKTQNLNNENLQLTNDLAHKSEEIARLTDEKQAQAESLATLQSEKDNCKSQNDQAQTELKLLKEQLAKQEADHKAQLEQQKTDFDERQKQDKDARQAEADKQLQTLKLELKGISEEVLKSRSAEFSETSKETFTKLTDPLLQQIADLQKKIESAKEAQISSKASLEEQLKALMQATEKTFASSEKLATALTAETKAQGNWGETILESILDAQGFVKGQQYDTQVTLTDKDGKPLRNNDSNKEMIPDAVVYWDRERALVIDSKVSLTAFVNYQNAETEEDKKEYLKAHLASVKKHVDELAKKDYSNYTVKSHHFAPFVMMFVPHEAALQLALWHDKNLWHEAMEKGVFIVGEMNLYAAMRVVQTVWRQEIQVEAVNKIYDVANELLERCGDFLNQYTAIGEQIGKLQTSYDVARKKLTKGDDDTRSQSIMVSLEKLIKLGVKESKKAKRNIPQSLKDESGLDFGWSALPAPDDNSATDVEDVTEVTED